MTDNVHPIKPEVSNEESWKTMYGMAMATVTYESIINMCVLGKYDKAYELAKSARVFGLSGMQLAVEEFILGCTNALKAEHNIVKFFRKNIQSLIPGAELVKVSLIPGNIPDEFIKIDGEVRPVEAKLDCFDYKALAQLQRYLRVYNMKNGVAVARRLSCHLPENITFCKIPSDFYCDM